MASCGLYFWKSDTLFSPHTSEKFVLKGMVPVNSMLMLQIINAKIPVPVPEPALTLHRQLCNSTGSSAK